MSSPLKTWLETPLPVPVAEVAEWAKKHGADAVAVELGSAFLLLRSTFAGGKIRSTVFTSVDRIATKKEVAVEDARVFFVRPTGRSPFPDFISVGRIVNNDVVLEDASVTKFHAYFRTENGVLALCDAGSSNGTFADGAPVPVKGQGIVVPKNKMTLRFGTVELVFLDAAGLIDVLKRC